MMDSAIDGRRLGGSATYHRAVHTNTYYSNDYNELSGCTSAEECTNTLRRIAQMLQSGDFIY